MLDFTTNGRLSHVMAAPTGYPTTTFIWARQNSGVNRMLFSEAEIAAGRRVKQHVFYTANGAGVAAGSLTSWGGAPGVEVGTELGPGVKAVMVVRNSASSVTLYTSTAPGGATDNSANALAGEFANADTLTVGASYFDGGYNGFAEGALGEYARWHGVALTAADFAALAGLSVAPVAPETIETASLYDVWDLNPAGSAGTPITGTLTGRVNGRVMTVIGNVTKSALSHPVTRTSSGATAVTLTGPSSGAVGVASTNFTVGANGTITGTVTVTPSDGGGGGTFTPTSVAISSGTPTATFTYTPGSAGAKTISVTNSGGLTNPSSLTYTASVPAATSMTIALKQSDGTTAAASITGIEVLLLNAATLGAATAVLDTWTGESTDGSGNLVLDITGLGVTVGQVRYVVAGKSNGTVGANFDGWHGPATAA